MNAPTQILTVWHKFDAFPMETLTKAWYYDQSSVRQRSVEEMKEHRERFGTSGNCFDLAIWLIDEFKRAGIEAYGLGEGLGTEEAHAAVCALDEQGVDIFATWGINGLSRFSWTSRQMNTVERCSADILQEAK